MSRPALHRAILIVDVESFSDPARTNADRLAIRKALYEALQESFDRAHISWTDCANEDRGDGVLILVPATVPKSWLVTGVPSHLAGLLERHNAACPPPERIRLRMALHAGEVHQDAHGFAGTSVNDAFRLIQAPPSRDALRTSAGEVALIVSKYFYEEVVRHHQAAGPSYFRQVPVVMKETKMPAWVRVLEGEEVPTQRDTGHTGPPELAQRKVAPPSRPDSSGDSPGSDPESAEPPVRRRLAWWVCIGTALVVLAACCSVLGYWGIGYGFAHRVGWGTLSVLVALSVLVTLSVVILVVRRWPSRISLRYRAAMACCVAAAGLLAGAALGNTNLVQPCAAPTELTVLTSQEDLAAVQAAIPGFEQNEPTRVHTACYVVDVTAYAAPTDYDAWRGLKTGWGASALSTVGPRPDVWIPGSSAELAAVREHNGPRLTSLGSIASSPLVVAVPTGLVSGPLARLPKLGNTWGSIYNALGDKRIGLAIPDPVVSETALLGTAGLYPNLTSAEKRGIESSGNFPADSENLLCGAAQTAERSDHPPSTAYLVSEAALIANNADQLSEGACATLTQSPEPLTAFYPVGAAALNFPFTTVQWDGSTTVSNTLSRYETGFYDWLTSPARSELTGAGLRPPGCGTFSQPPAGITPVVPDCGTANLPTAEAAAGAQSSFQRAQAPAHIVIGIDDSGPMQPYLPQITAAVDAELGPGGTHVGSRDSFGIWKLPGDRKGQIDQQLVGFGAAGVTEARVPADVGVLTGHDHSADYSMLTQAGQLLYAQSAMGVALSE